MRKGKKNEIVIYVIRGSTIKKFVILDILVGSGIFYVVKFIFASFLIASAGSFLGTEGIKRAPKIFRRS